jgi:hypothetical protein
MTREEILRSMARHCAAWCHVLKPHPPTRQKEAIMYAYFEGDLAPEETGALIGALKLKEA